MPLTIRWASKMACIALIAGTGRAAASQTPSSTPAQIPSPCESDPVRRRFDFWIGEWDVEDSATGKTVGRSAVQPIAGGCGLLENWTALNGFAGKSINAYNPVLRHWQQFWIGYSGFVTEYRDSEWRGDTIEFHADGVDATGHSIQWRLSFNRRSDGSVRQFSEQSADGGKTWTPRYEYLYHRQH